MIRYIMKKQTAIYVSVGKPLEFRRFELYKSPMGWHRIDLLQKHLKEDKEYRSKFSKEEIKEVMNYV
jgi:hypothetical protein